MRLEEAERIVAPILDAVRERGDAALLEYARKFDGFEGSSVRMRSARDACSRSSRRAVETAAKNIREYARAATAARDGSPIIPDGRRLGQIVRPLDSMGAYIPAGRYPLPSTLLMTVIPAQVAGVADHLRRVPESQCRRFWASRMAGRHAHVSDGRRAGHRRARVRNRDGAEGRSHRRSRKYLCRGGEEADRGRDRHRLRRRADGDRDHRRRWRPALDRRRHAGAGRARCRRVGDSADYFARVWRMPSPRKSSANSRRLPTAAVARPSIETNGAIVVVDSLEQAVEFSNALAPEHLALHDAQSAREDPDMRARCFVGPSSPEAAGDYASGPNHVLPTSGAARLAAGCRPPISSR